MLRSLLSLLAAIFLILASTSIYQAQVFEDFAATYGISERCQITNFGQGMSVHDYDGNGTEDITFCAGGDTIRVYSQVVPGGFDLLTLYTGSVGQAKSLSWVDFDNDGDKDLFVLYFQGSMVLLENQGDNVNFENIAVSAGLEFGNDIYFGHSWGDYDADGFLDIFVCTQAFSSTATPNHLYHNNGDGTFSRVTSDVGLPLFVGTTFQSVFADYDRDGDQDILVIIDRTINENRLYQNNGNGTFSDITDGSGFNIAINAMSNSSGDFDNDLDLDWFVTNDQTGHRLLESTPEGFVDVTAETGTAHNVFSWGANWLDANADGWLDLHIGSASNPFIGSRNAMFINNEGEDFTLGTNQYLPNLLTYTYSSGIGDINNDGLPDIVSYNGENISDTNILINTTENANTLVVNLQGVVSNRDAVGSYVTIWTDGNPQLRQVGCGQDFLGQSSAKQMFGLGTATSIDSLIVNWPSGHVDQFFGIMGNTSIDIVEGSGTKASLAPVANNSICEGDSVLVAANETFATYDWNNGAEGQSIWVSESGTYSYTGTTSNGFSATSGQVEISVNPFATAEAEITPIDCFGAANGTITLLGAPGQTYDWGNGVETNILEGLAPGEYSVSISNDAGCSTTENFTLTEPEELIATVQATDVACFGDDDGVVAIQIDGGVPEYTLLLNEVAITQTLLVNQSAGEYSLEVTDANNCTSSTTWEIMAPPAIAFEAEATLGEMDGEASIDLSYDGGTPPYNLLWSNGAENEDTQENLPPGEYGVWLIDNNGCTAYVSVVIDAIIGITEISGQENFQVYPNPSVARAVVQLGGKIYNLAVYDLQGRLILQTNSNAGATALSTSEMQSGMYLLRGVLENGQQVSTTLILTEN